jgi:hypothetical protein
VSSFFIVSLGQRVRAEANFGIQNILYIDWDRSSAADDRPGLEGRAVHMGRFCVCIRLDGTRTPLRRASTGMKASFSDTKSVD